MMMDEEEKYVFSCDHPFVFLLYHKRMHTVLFVGVYNKPNNWRGPKQANTVLEQIV